MKRKKMVRRSRPDRLERLQNDLVTFGKSARRAIWNIYSWIGLIALIYIIVVPGR